MSFRSFVLVALLFVGIPSNVLLRADDVTTYHGKIAQPESNDVLTTNANWAVRGKLWTELTHDPPEPDDPVISPWVGMHVVIEVWEWDPVLNETIGEGEFSFFSQADRAARTEYSL